MYILFIFMKSNIKENMENTLTKKWQKNTDEEIGEGVIMIANLKIFFFSILCNFPRRLPTFLQSLRWLAVFAGAGGALLPFLIVSFVFPSQISVSCGVVSSTIIVRHRARIQSGSKALVLFVFDLYGLVWLCWSLHRSGVEAFVF